MPQTAGFGNTAGAEPDLIRRHLEEVIHSGPFAGSDRLRRLLRFIVETALAGDAARLKEYTIGLDVFQRGADYDPQVDSTVRVHAAKLRDKLREYYLTEGRGASLRIDLPKGSYVPVFHAQAVAVQPAEDSSVPPAPEDRSRSGSSQAAFAVPGRERRLMWAAAGAAVVAFASLAVALTYRREVQRQPGQPGPIRFVVYPPEHWVFRSTPHVSPDGRKVACTIFNSVHGEKAIYLHNLESGAGSILSATKGAAYSPAWSNDSKSILFTIGNKIAKLDLNSGSEPTVAGEGTTAWGVASNERGTLLTGGNPGPLVRLFRGGRDTSPAPIGIPGMGETGRAQMFPQFLPDGNRFLYFLHGPTSNESAVYVAALDGKLNKRLMAAEANAVLVPDSDRNSPGGDLLFVRGDRLLAQRFNLTRLEIVGEPRQVADGVRVWLYGTGRFSATQNVIAYSSDSGVSSQFAWFDRSGRKVGVLGPVAEVNNPAISPDGTRVAYDCVQGQDREIWVTEIRSDNAVRITFNADVDHTAVWSPDSRQIAFESHRKPQGLYVTPSSGGGTATLILSGGDLPSDWTRDGRFLLFNHMSSEPHVYHPWLVPANRTGGPQEVQRSGGNEYVAVLSPDNRWIAYESDDSGQRNIYVRRFNGESSLSTGKWQISTAGGTQPVWRYDGRELYFISSENRLMMVAVGAGSSFRYSKPQPLFDWPLPEVLGPRNDYATRDGKRFLIRMPDPRSPGPPLHVIVNWRAQNAG